MFVFYEHQDSAWRSFRNLLSVEIAYSIDQVLPVLQRVEQAVETQRCHAFGYVSYEAAAAFDAALVTHPARMPLVWFGLFAESTLSKQLPQAEAFPFEEAPPIAWTPSLTLAEYQRQLEKLHLYLQRGDSYQINFTMRLHCAWKQSLAALWAAFLGHTPAPYASYLNIERFSIGSLSPELFFELDGDRLLLGPMKGTRPRGRTLAEDRLCAEELRSSPKEQSENLMIVDLMRSDLGRIAQPASVHVEQLLCVQKFPSTWQLVSTISARSQASVVQIFAALFPSGSVTGAPKCRSMQLIKELESSPREVYTGAIGYLLPGRKARFNVAIRTLICDQHAQQLEYGVGGGIVFEADATAEYAECLTKARAVRQPACSAGMPFGLIETMLWEPGQGYFLLDLHLKRLNESAEYYSIPLDLAQIRALLEARKQQFAARKYRLRLVLLADGALTLEHAELEDKSQLVRLALAEYAIDSRQPTLFHKTTDRSVYEQALKSRPGADQVLLWNERGELTEACNANLVLRIDERYLTPPVDSGLLPGTMRRSLLERGKIAEQVLKIGDIERCSEIFLVNSVRGWQRAQLV